MNTAYYTSSLNGNWELSRFAVGKGTPDKSRRAEHIPVCVPGDIHQALQQAGEIGNPLVGNQIERLKYLEELEWWYRRTFVLKSKRAGIRYFLWFGGIDLHGRVFLNGQELGETNNAFTPYEFDVTEYIVAGENELLVAVDCGLYTSLVCQQVEKYDPQDPGSTDAPVDWRRVQLRKPQFSFWWDWAKRMLTTGLSRSVELRAYREVRILDLHAWESFKEDGGVIVRLEAETDALAGYSVRFTLEGYGTRLAQVIQTDENGTATANFILDNPHLWYPNGYGEQALYTLEAEIVAGDETLSRACIRHGIRHIELDQSPLPNTGKQRFTIRVNGKAIYCKGGNWVPADSIPANVTDEKYDQLLSAARDAHYTMLRVWGGGTYERDRFYELCDEYGILLWHDFMFANGYFPTDMEDFRNNVQRELPLIIKQLRNYACIALWCGNNEIHWQHLILQQFMPVFYGRDIYEEMLPKLLAEMDGTRPYRFSSPYGRMAVDPQDEGEGDTHSWYIWLGNDEEKALNIENFLTDESHFVSEYGVLSYPNYASMRIYLCGDVSFNNPAWETHNNYQEIGRIGKMLDRYYVEDNKQLDMRKLIHFSQYMQGDIYRFSMETFIRRAPECMGVLFWMFNDCWGCTSWTCIDYYGRKKASWYMVKRAFSPVLASMLCRENTLRFWVVQNTGEVYNNVKAEWGIRFFNGQVLWQERRVIDRLESGISQELPAIGVTQEQCLTTYGFMRITDEVGHVLYENTQLLSAYKNLVLPQTHITIRLVDQGDNTELYITTDSYAVCLFIETEEGEPSDNGMDLEHGREYCVKMDGKPSIESLEASALNATVSFIDERIGN